MFGKAFWPLVGLLVLEFLYYLFVIGYFTDRRLDHALKRAQRHSYGEDFHRDLNRMTQILADYESHVAAAEIVLWHPDMSGIETVREQLAYAREVVGTSAYSRQTAPQEALRFFRDYDPPPVGVATPASRTRLKILLWLTAAVAAVALACIFQRPEW